MMASPILTEEEADTLRRGSAPYGGSWFAYDLDTELTKARERERIRERAKVRLQREAERLQAETDPYRSIAYGTGRPVAQPPRGANVGVPTPEALRRHAERFGKEGIQEVADLYGVDLEARSAVRQPKKPRSPARRASAMKNAIQEVGV
jgi:hypothetical protein